MQVATVSGEGAHFEVHMIVCARSGRTKCQLVNADGKAAFRAMG